MTIFTKIRPLALIVGFAITSTYLSGPALAVDGMSASADVDLTSVRAKIKQNDYVSALKELRDLSEDTQNADVYNLLGFTLRKTGDTATALSYYTQALALQPDHKGAHEYLGELYVETGKLDKAREQLAVLTKLCPVNCEEREDLEKAIAAKATN